MKNHRIWQGFLWLLEGIIVGFGAIMPGISGGTLCVAFGMYKPLIEILSKPRSGIKKHWKMIGVFVVGGMVGFIGLSGLASWLMEKNSQAVTCAFIGFILGTFPELWQDAGQKGRKRTSYLSIFIGFAAMLGLLLFLQGSSSIAIQPDLWGYLLCGVLWGISFVVPGLSSSTLLLFFGLYQPMLNGIAELSFEVLLPVAGGAAVCLLIFPKVVGIAYQKFYSVISHGVLGIVAATTVMIVPSFRVDAPVAILYIVCMIGGAALSYLLGMACRRLKNSQER